MLMKMEGHEVRVVYSGMAAVEIAKTYQPDVILVEVGMTGMDGNEAARCIREHPRPVMDTASASGKVGYSCGYHYARFDNLQIDPIPGETTARLVRAVATSDHPGYEAANAIDGDPSTLWHVEWTPWRLFRKR